MGRISGWLVVWLVHVGLWLIFVSQLSKWEVVVGAAAAGVATFGVGVVQRLGLAKFRWSWRQIAEAWRTPWYAVSGTWEILQGIKKQLFTKAGAPSRLAAVRFKAGADDAASAGRRGLAVLYTTMTPNFIVIGIIREQGLLVYHQIIPGEVLAITRNLGAEA